MSNSIRKDFNPDRSPSFLRQFGIATTFLASVFLSACTGELTPSGGGGGGGGADAGGADGGSITAREMQYRDMVEPIFSATRNGGTCISCHRTTQGGPQFLGVDASKGYATIVADSRFIKMPGTSSLLVTKGAHAGAEALASGEVTTIASWVDAEVAAKN